MTEELLSILGQYWLSYAGLWWRALWLTLIYEYRYISPRALLVVVGVVFVGQLWTWPWERKQPKHIGGLVKVDENHWKKEG